MALTQKRYKRIVARSRALLEHASPLQVMRYLGDLRNRISTRCGYAISEVLTIGAFDAEHSLFCNLRHRQWSRGKERELGRGARPTLIYEPGEVAQTFAQLLQPPPPRRRPNNHGPFTFCTRRPRRVQVLLWSNNLFELM